MKSKAYMAADLGASNGRTIAGRFDGEKLAIEEISRFENSYVRVGDAYFWDVLALYQNITDGIGRYGKENEDALCGIGIDTWGVDFGLIDKQGRLLGNPRAYRDPRGLRGMQTFQKKHGRRAAFDITGIANMEFNTLYQLYDMAQQGDVQLVCADKLLLMPDLLAYMLCGRMSCEYTQATTTQMLGTDGAWSKRIADMAGINMQILPQIQMSGEKKAALYPHIQEGAGLQSGVPVYCIGSHDTASAVASVPAATDNYAFLSSGTWSLLGIVQKDAMISDAVYENEFSNEGTITGGVRLLRNIMGMWIIQNCKRQWDNETPMSWDDVVEAANAAPAFTSFIDVTAHDFYDGGDMAGKIQQYCKDTGQPVPQTKEEIARTVYESLALCYKEAFDGLQVLKGGRIDVLHIVGGGANNRLVNQMTASALDRPVVAGPAEATAIGNLMVQVKASGGVKDMAQAREVIRSSFDVETYLPRDMDEWRAQFERYIKIKKRYLERQNES